MRLNLEELRLLMPASQQSHLVCLDVDGPVEGDVDHGVPGDLGREVRVRQPVPVRVQQVRVQQLVVLALLVGGLGYSGSSHKLVFYLILSKDSNPNVPNLNHTVPVRVSEMRLRAAPRRPRPRRRRGPAQGRGPAEASRGCR